MKTYFLIFFALFISNMNSQKLNGKWAMVVDGDTYTIPKCIIIEFKNNEEILYSFDKQVDSTDKIEIDYEMKKITGTGNIKTFKFINDNRLVLYSHNDQSKTIHNREFVRLVETKVSSPVKDAINYKFSILTSTKHKEPEIWRFDNPVESEELLKLSAKLFPKSYLTIEKLDDTYFVVDNSDEIKERILPIKEINKDYLLIYGLSDFNDFVKANRL